MYYSIDYQYCIECEQTKNAQVAHSAECTKHCLHNGKYARCNSYYSDFLFRNAADGQLMVPHGEQCVDRTPCESMMLHSSGKTRFSKRGGVPPTLIPWQFDNKKFHGEDMEAKISVFCGRFFARFERLNEQDKCTQMGSNYFVVRLHEAGKLKIPIEISIRKYFC